MKTLLRIDCSSRTHGSHSRALADCFEQQWKIVNPKGVVIKRDLALFTLPHIQNNTIEGFYTPAEYVTSETINATALSDELITELKSADEIVISSPLYNLNVPSNLKAYLDQVVRIGHTFNINENGYYGLLTDKKAYLVTTKGGTYRGTPMENFDFQEPYLNAILNHMGIQVQEMYSLESTSNNDLLSSNRLAVENSIKQTLTNKNEN